MASSLESEEIKVDLEISGEISSSVEAEVRVLNLTSRG